MKQAKVIFIDSVHPVLFERLEEAGYSCEWRTELSRQEVMSILPNYVGAVIRSKFTFDEEVFGAAKNLKWIARSGAGMENINLELAKQNNISCFNSPEGNRDAVAEHALGMLLCLFNKLNQANTEVKQGVWDREGNRGIELKGKTVGILGYGFMGEAFAQRLQGFGVNVIAYDKYKSGFSSNIVKEVSEEEFFEKTEVLSIHLPQTTETIGLVNDMFINKFVKQLYIVNTARGKNIDTKCLLKNLENNKVIGACLDVLEFESNSFEKISLTTNITFQKLAKKENVLLSPHVAGWTTESYKKLSIYLADKILSHFQPNS